MDRDWITRRRAILHIGGQRFVYSRPIGSIEDVENQELHESNENVENSFNEEMEIEQVENVTVGMNNISFGENNGELNCMNLF